MIRIPYPIPQLDRLELIEAGRAAADAFHKRESHPATYCDTRRAVERVLRDLESRHGVECEQ